MRNCSGNGSPAKIVLNEHYYKRCPVATYLENLEARYMVSVYFECRNNNVYPAPGSWGDQTAFCSDLFQYIDGLVAESENAKARALAAKNKT